MSKQFELLEGSQQKPLTSLEVQDWIVFHLAELLEVNPNEIDVTTPFGRYGLDSSEAIGMTGELEDWLGKELHPTLLYDYPTIEKLAEYVVSSN
ncbi:acyl carrier protein [Myxosarcina sp. GI1(2024)]